MVTFRDLKSEDYIYEVGIESKKIWINKIEDISVSEFFKTFKCLDQEGLRVHIDIPVQDLNKSICKNGSVYATNMNLLFKAICDS